MDWSLKALVVIGAAVLGAMPGHAQTSSAQAEPPGAAAFRARNFAGAYLELLPAAHAGNPQAQFMLGQMSDSGLGVQLDHAEAARWYRMAADHGNAPAQYALARAYAEGRGVAVDYRSAVAWLAAAAYGNFVPAILAIADLNDRGAGMPANPDQATEWLRRAAQLGSPRARYVLGERLLAGRGATPDATEGWRWIRSAADLGDSSAMLRLGQAVAAEGHRATREHRLEGMTMLMLAQRYGSDEIKREAARARLEVQRHMFPDELAEANGRARAWQPPAGAAEIDGPRMPTEAPRPTGPGARPGQPRNGSSTAQRR
jgi:TPR repeat protein